MASAISTGGRYYAQPPTLTPTPTPTPTATPPPVTGDAATSTITDGSGNYQFSSLASGGSYDVTPSKTARKPGSFGINTTDVIAVQRHFLNIAPLAGCRLTAADVNGNTIINTVDGIAIQRFFFGHSNANVGKYQFIPAGRSYLKVGSNQPGQNYDALVFGDVVTPYANPRDGGPSPDPANAE